MTYVVTERCASNRYSDCVADCPVDCFYEIQDPHMLIVNPDECIDCDAALLAKSACATFIIWFPKGWSGEYTGCCIQSISSCSCD